jgi:pSer/pThr/pTyr-binding forkhead associated (FHA) protein
MRYKPCAMECPKCGATNENPVGSCLSCGAPLPEEEGPPTVMASKALGKLPSGGARLQSSNVPPKQCPSCNTLNAATFKFCARCGTPLGATAAPVMKAAPVVPQARASSPQPPAKVPALAPKSAPVVGAPPKLAPVVSKVAPAVASKPAPAGPAVSKAPPAIVRPPPPAPPKLAPKPAPKAAPPPRPRARVSAIARDGSRSADFVLTRDETRVGRAVADGEVKLDKDPFIAPVHALFKFENDQLLVQDTGAQNGVFLWLKERELQSGDELRMGRQRLRIEWMPEEPEVLAEQPVWGSPNPGYVARAVQLLEGGGEGDIFPLKAGDNLVGRGTGDVSFPQDGYVSSRHATITVGNGRIAVKDMGSANGTFVRVSTKAALSPGDLLLVGDQILRVDPA